MQHNAYPSIFTATVSSLIHNFFINGILEIVEIESLIALICSGVVPQQPPMIETPASTSSFDFSAMNSGVSR